MSKQATAGIRKKPEFKIILGLPDVSKGSGKTTPRVTTRTDDLQAAINSITADGITANTVRVYDSGKKAIASNGTPREKIIFTPKTVQKRVMVLKKEEEPRTVTQFTPKKIAPKVHTVYTPAKVTPAPLKKRRLGDFALQSLHARTLLKTEPEPTALCRICGLIIQGNTIPLTETSGALTEAGAKLKTVVGSEITNDGVHPTTCCIACSLKVKVCFSLLLELQASEEVMKSTYDDLQDGDIVQPSCHIHVCSYCDMEVMGTKDFVKHIEKHLIDKEMGTSQSAEEDTEKAATQEDEQSIMWNGRIFVEDDVEEDGTTHQPNADGVHTCQFCNRGFKYLFLLRLHNKYSKRPTSVNVKTCFACRQSWPGMMPCKVGDTIALICQNCREGAM